VVERVEDELVAAWLGVAESTVERKCRERDLLQKKLGRRLVFYFIFGPNFLLPHAMKSTSIYRRWKRAILSTQEKNFQPLIRLGRIPTVGSK